MVSSRRMERWLRVMLGSSTRVESVREEMESWRPVSTHETNGAMRGGSRVDEGAAPGAGGGLMSEVRLVMNAATSRACLARFGDRRKCSSEMATVTRCTGCLMRPGMRQSDTRKLRLTGWVVRGRGKVLAVGVMKEMEEEKRVTCEWWKMWGGSESIWRWIAAGVIGSAGLAKDDLTNLLRSVRLWSAWWCNIPDSAVADAVEMRRYVTCSSRVSLVTVGTSTSIPSSTRFSERFVLSPSILLIA